MNKDVIYIEPEDDITDIILKIENSKEKIVALVPPKKAGVFRSVVNIKLIAKAGASSEKTIVLVTVDPSIMKLAAATKIPVAKNLQSAPVVPKVDLPEIETEEEDELEEEEDEEDEVDSKDSKNTKSETAEPKDKSKSNKDDKAEEDAEDEEDEDEDEEEDEEPAKKSKKTKKTPKLSGNKILDWIKTHKKTTIFAGVVLVGMIGFLIWAFGFAPAVDITVAIKTDQKNFSEGITFTDKLTDENSKEGKFYLEQKKLESVQEVSFEATGQKNQGEKASGEVVVYAYFNEEGSRIISQGTIFTINGLNFVANESLTLSWKGGLSNIKNCDNKANASSLEQSGCQISGRVGVTAAEAGSKYNIAASQSGWDTVARVGVYSDKAMSGGSDDIITVVQQSDVEKAKSELTTAKEDEAKAKLYETIDDKYYIIDASFEQTTDNAVSTPAVDEEAKDGVKPTLKATTVASVYVIDKVKLEEFIKNKAALEENQEVYDIKDIYIDNVSQLKDGATGKLKAQYYIGPKITESEVVDKVKGRGLGDAQREIRDIYGVSDVKIDKSYPWVMSVPGDSNKVTVKFEVKDQNGNEIKEQDSSDEKTENSEDADDKKDENTKKE